MNKRIFIFLCVLSMHIISIKSSETITITEHILKKATQIDLKIEGAELHLFDHKTKEKVQTFINAGNSIQDILTKNTIFGLTNINNLGEMIASYNVMSINDNEGKKTELHINATQVALTYNNVAPAKIHGKCAIFNDTLIVQFEGETETQEFPLHTNDAINDSKEKNNRALHLQDQWDFEYDPSLASQKYSVPNIALITGGIVIAFAALAYYFDLIKLLQHR